MISFGPQEGHYLQMKEWKLEFLEFLSDFQEYEE